MYIEYDASADAAYIYLVEHIEQGAVVRTEAEWDPTLHLIFDFDIQDKLLGIEVQGASHVLSDVTLAAAKRIG